MIGSHVFSKYQVSVFTEMTGLANEHNAINLSQGFPNFEGPQSLKEVFIEEIKNGWNQYISAYGLQELRESLSEYYLNHYALKYDANTEITITQGATEALFNTITGILNAGDEVIVFEPFYDAYIPDMEIIGAKPIPIALDIENSTIPFDTLIESINGRTKAIILNMPHNPSGIVLSDEDLHKLAEIANNHDLLVFSDEVYEHITFDGVEHHPIAQFPGMRERTVIISSIGKSFSFTGWKVGWCCGPEHLIRSIRASHQFTTYSNIPASQKAASAAVKLEMSYYDELTQMYQDKRNLLFDGAKACGFKPIQPKGTYFFLADYSELSDEDPITFAHRLVKEAGVALIPPNSFYLHEYHGKHLRFCFSKTDDILNAALEKLSTYFNR
jgi:aspartate/methionine/tyrosine aminotransferase